MDISKLANPNDIITEVVNYTSFPLNKIDMLVGRELYEDLRYNDSLTGNPIFPRRKIITLEDLKRLKPIIESNHYKLPFSVKVVSLINTVKPPAMDLKDRMIFEKSLSSAKNNLRPNGLKSADAELDKITKSAEAFVSNVKLSSLDGGISYNYLDYGMVNPSSYDRTINALIFIVSLGKGYNNTVPSDDKLDLVLLSQIAMLSTVGDMYAPEKLSNDIQIGKINSKTELNRFYSDTVGNDDFKKRCPNFNISMLDDYDKKNVTLYSYLMIKNKGKYSNVSALMLDTILKVNENIDGSGPLGMKLDGKSKSDKLASVIKLGFLWQDKLIELRNNSGLDKQIHGEINSVTDFYQSLRQIAKNNEIDENLLNIMIKINPLYQNMDAVKLSDGRIATVAKQNDKNPELPIVATKNKDGNNELIDLSNEKNTNITISNGFATYEIEYLMSANAKVLGEENPETTVKLR